MLGVLVGKETGSPQGQRRGALGRKSTEKLLMSPVLFLNELKRSCFHFLSLALSFSHLVFCSWTRTQGNTLKPPFSPIISIVGAQ